MAVKKSSQKESYWRALVTRQASSGMSIRKFCDSEQISEASFYSWRRELALRDRETTAAKPRQSVSKFVHPAKNAEEFVPLQLIDVPGTLDVIHPLGCQIRITGHVDVTVLKQVLDALDERGQA